MQDYFLASLAGLWLADGLALLIAPHWIIEQVRYALQQSPLVLRWHILSILAGMSLSILTVHRPYQPLWIVVGISMVITGTFLWVGPEHVGQPAPNWCLTRDDVDYRVWGLVLCTLAVLLFHAIGWIGQA